MNIGVLFSGGKDSTYAAYLMKQQGHTLSCLLTVESENKHSYMFHTPSISQVHTQAQAMQIPLLLQHTKGEKEKELDDLEQLIRQAVQQFHIQGVVTGALESEYQKKRVQAICDTVQIHCLNPLWKMNTELYWNTLLQNHFEIMIIGVSADGMGEEWLGTIIDKQAVRRLADLSKKFRIHACFEGGEAETFVVDCPLFYKKVHIIKAEKHVSKQSGIYDITKTMLVDK